jgi:hypothetical protein
MRFEARDAAKIIRICYHHAVKLKKKLKTDGNCFIKFQTLNFLCFPLKVKITAGLACRFSRQLGGNFAAGAAHC